MSQKRVGRRPIISSPDDVRSLANIYGKAAAPPIPEPTEYPVYLNLDDVLGLIAYGRTMALRDEEPGVSEFFERWQSKVTGGYTHPKPQKFLLLRDMHKALARVRRWQRCKRLGVPASPSPLRPLPAGNRACVRWIIRRHHLTAANTIRQLWADLRQLYAVTAEHESKTEDAIGTLCRAVADGTLPMLGRPGKLRTGRTKRGAYQRVPPEFFADTLAKITRHHSGWAISGLDGSTEDYAAWEGPDWGELRFRREEVFRLWPPTRQPAVLLAAPADGWHSRHENPAIAIRARHTQRFRTVQRGRREWINFEEIADWCGRRPGDIKPDQERCTLAYAELRKSLMAGEFERTGRSCVLFLYKHSRYIWMTAERLGEITSFHGDDVVRSQYLSNCWIPYDHCRRWFDAKKLQLPPWPVPATSGALHGLPVMRRRATDSPDAASQPSPRDTAITDLNEMAEPSASEGSKPPSVAPSVGPPNIRRSPEAADQATGDQQPQCPWTREDFAQARDPLPLLVEWAKWKYRAGPVAGRDGMLKDHRQQYEFIRGINQKTMILVRRKVAPPEAKRGGAPTHRST